MGKGQSPLVGYNTNLRHKGKTFHVQTEDSGVKRPHIISHIFADGGRIVATRKTSYSEHVDAENLEEIVRKLMKDQHKEMLVGLRDGIYDEEMPPLRSNAPGARARKTSDVDVEALERAAEARIRKSSINRAVKPAKLEALNKAAEARVRKLTAGRARTAAGLDIDTLEKAAEARIGKSAFSGAPSGARKGRSPRTTGPETRSSSQRNLSIFGGDQSGEKSLDDVILSYLIEDSGEKK